MHAIEKERRLVERAKAGCFESFEELEAENRIKVSAFIMKATKDFHEAEEIYQQGITKAWAKLETFRGESRYSTWLSRVCYNLFLDKKRKDKREDTVSLEGMTESGRPIKIDWSRPFFNPEAKGAQPEVIESGYKHQLEKDLNETLSSLPENKKRVLYLFAIKEKSYEQISEELGVPMGTVMSRLFYARKLARKSFKRIRNKKNEHKKIKIS